MRIPVANVAFDNLDMGEAIAAISRMARESGGTRYVCTGNLDHLAILHRDPDFVLAYHGADLVLADGAPVLWLSRLAPPRYGGPLRERVAGSDLFWELARESAASGLRLFFLGGVPGAAENAKQAVLNRHPEALICGTYCPPIEQFASDEEQLRIRKVIQDAAPHVLLVAFGAPKQEKWIAANKNSLGVPVAIGVGGSFEMAGGAVRRAPLWMQRNGLEWMFRFCQEPSRLFGRYFMRDLPFLFFLAGRSILVRSRPGNA